MPRGSEWLFTGVSPQSTQISVAIALLTAVVTNAFLTEPKHLENMEKFSVEGACNIRWNR